MPLIIRDDHFYTTNNNDKELHVIEDMNIDENDPELLLDK